MGLLPAARTASLSPSDPVPSALLNELQDGLIALDDFLSGGAQSFWPTSIVLPANGSVTVSGTGKFKHGTKTINIPTKANGSGTGVDPGQSLQWADATIRQYIWIHGVPVGARILTIRAKIQDNTANAMGMYFRVKTQAALAVPSFSLHTGPTTSSGAGAVQLLTLSSINYTVPAFTEMVITFDIGASTTSNIYDIELDYDQP